MEEKKEKKLPWHLLSVAAIAMLIVGITIYQYTTHFSGVFSDRHEYWGQFGDFFGGVLNPSLSFLSLMALLLTLFYQNKELNLTRDELEKSTKALQAQERSLNQQNFDNTFFNLIKLHNEIVDSLSIGLHTKEVRGRKVFSGVAPNIKNHYRPQLHNVSEVELATNLFKEALNTKGLIADHYFRNLYRIVMFVQDSSQNEKLDIDKSFYIGTLRAQLSADELTVLFFNGLTPSGAKFKKLIEQYQLFDNIRIHQLPKRKELLDLYDRSAFGACDVEFYLSSPDK